MHEIWYKAWHMEQNTSGAPLHTHVVLSSERGTDSLRVVVSGRPV